jgi:hypothetical protein
VTAADWLAVLDPWLTEPLFEASAVERLRCFAQTLPGESQGTLEVRLAPGASRVDLSLCLRKPWEARAFIGRWNPAVNAFLASWSEPEGPLAPVRSVWLEFDLDRDDPAPVLCAKLPRSVDPEWLTGTLLPALQEGPLPARQQELILATLETLPSSASLLYVFNLKARGSDAVRLEIFGLEPAGMLDSLQGVAPEIVSAVEPVAPLFEGVERLHLSFDVTGEIFPRIGIEGSFPRQPSREPGWSALLERLVGKDLCSPAKRDALLAWPGYDTFWTAPLRWPAELGPRGACIRLLSHLKIVCGPDRDPEAKAYLVFGPPDRSSDAASASRSTRFT